MSEQNLDNKGKTESKKQKLKNEDATNKIPFYQQSRRQVLSATAAGIGTAALAGCSGGSGGGEDGSGSDDESMETVKAAWLYFAQPGDLGWTASHDRGVEATKESMDNVETTVVENVDVSKVRQTASQLAEEGNDVIFGAATDFTDPMAAASEQYPDTAFETASGLEISDNNGSYYIKNYQSLYLAGYAAGLLTENDKIGFVAAKPVATVYQDINGFAAGIQASNPDATLHLQWSNTWFDPPTESENAQVLLDENDVDVMGQHQDSAAVLETTAEAGKWAVGSFAPMGEFAGENYVTSPLFAWEVVHETIINEVRKGTWEADMTFPGIAQGASVVDDWGPEVPDDVINEVGDIKSDMMGSDDAADDIVWSGTPLADMSDEELLFNLDILALDNIEGEEL